MAQNNKTLLWVGIAAAYAAYKYSQMSPEKKESLKEKAKNLVEEYLPGNLKGLLGLDDQEGKLAGEKSLFKSGF